MQENITKEIESVVKLGPDVDQSDPKALAMALANAVNDLPDKVWDTLPDQAQAWANYTVEQLSLAGEAALSHKEFAPVVKLPDEWVPWAMQNGIYKPKTKSTNGGNGHDMETQTETSKPVIRESAPVARAPAPTKTKELTTKEKQSLAMKKRWAERRKLEAQGPQKKAVLKVKARPTPTQRHKARGRVGTPKSPGGGPGFALAKGLDELQFLVKVAKQPDCPPSIKASIKAMVEAEITKFIGDFVTARESKRR